MPHIILDNRTLITFEGPDATHLLHNVITCNIEGLKLGTAQIAGLLTPQGKILFDFFVSKAGDNHFVIDIDTAQAGAFIQRMTMYRLRSKVEITESSESLVAVCWDDDSQSSSDGLRDCRFKDIDVFRCLAATGAATSTEAFDQLRIAHGVAESGKDYALGDAFPHDVSFDQNGGVDFKKGCYIGQEVVSRMHHRSTARRRILIAQTTTGFDGTDITAGGKALGTLGTIVGNQALGLCRIDRVKDAMDKGDALMVGASQITLSLPPHVSYDWPHEANDA